MHVYVVLGTVMKEKTGLLGRLVLGNGTVGIIVHWYFLARFIRYSSFIVCQVYLLRG